MPINQVTNAMIPMPITGAGDRPANAISGASQPMISPGMNASPPSQFDMPGTLMIAMPKASWARPKLKKCPTYPSASMAVSIVPPSA